MATAMRLESAIMDTGSSTMRCNSGHLPKAAISTIKATTFQIQGLTSCFCAAIIWHMVSHELFFI